MLALKRRFDFGSCPRRLRGVVGNVMRVPDDIRKCVLFIGQLLGPSGWRSYGTGFFITHKGLGYLVTARHVAALTGDDPVHMRVNLKDGTALVIHNDPLAEETGDQKWHYSDDEDVDLAVLPLHIDMERFSIDHIFLEVEVYADFSGSTVPPGVGSQCYAVGLFTALEKQTEVRRNLPVVHTGNIALSPWDGRIPVQSKSEPGKIYNIEGYLVELTNLAGLSGSPVFVRPETWISEIGGRTDALIPRWSLYLLGVWQGSWESSPALEYERPHLERVPMGMGIVIPVAKLMALLNQPSVEAHRAAFSARMKWDCAPTPDLA